MRPQEWIDQPYYKLYRINGTAFSGGPNPVAKQSILHIPSSDFSKSIYGIFVLYEFVPLQFSGDSKFANIMVDSTPAMNPNYLYSLWTEESTDARYTQHLQHGGFCKIDMTSQQYSIDINVISNGGEFEVRNVVVLVIEFIGHLFLYNNEYNLMVNPNSRVDLCSGRYWSRGMTFYHSKPNGYAITYDSLLITTARISVVGEYTTKPPYVSSWVGEETVTTSMCVVAPPNLHPPGLPSCSAFVSIDRAMKLMQQESLEYRLSVNNPNKSPITIASIQTSVAIVNLPWFTLASCAMEGQFSGGGTQTSEDYTYKSTFVPCLNIASARHGFRVLIGDNDKYANVEATFVNRQTGDAYDDNKKATMRIDTNTLGSFPHGWSLARLIYECGSGPGLIHIDVMDYYDESDYVIRRAVDTSLTSYISYEYYGRYVLFSGQLAKYPTPYFGAEVLYNVYTRGSAEYVTQSELWHRSNALLLAEHSVSHYTDSYLLQVYQHTIHHLTDASLAAEHELWHDTDSMLASQIETYHTADALAAAEHSIYHLTDSLLQAQIRPWHTTDALKLAEKSIYHDTDALLYSQIEIEHTTDSLLYGGVLRHTTDSRLSQTDIEKYHYTDSRIALSVLSALIHATDALLYSQIEMAHTTKSLLLKQEEISHYTDSMIYYLGTPEHTTDAAIWGTMEIYHTTSSLIGNIVAHSTDALLKKTMQTDHYTDSLVASEISTHHLTDALLEGTTSVYHLTNASLNVSPTIYHTSDALLAAERSASHTTNSLFSGTKVHTTDSGLYWTDHPISHTADALAYVERFIYHKTNSLLYESYTVSHNTDALTYWETFGEGSINFGDYDPTSNEIKGIFITSNADSDYHIFTIGESIDDSNSETLKKWLPPDNLGRYRTGERDRKICNELHVNLSTHPQKGNDCFPCE